MKFTYTGIEVVDLDRSIAFYTKGLGKVFQGRGPQEQGFPASP